MDPDIIPSGVFLTFQPDFHEEMFSVLSDGPPHVTLKYTLQDERKDSGTIMSEACKALTFLPHSTTFDGTWIETFIKDKATRNLRSDLFLVLDEESNQFVRRVCVECGITPDLAPYRMRVAQFDTAGKAVAAETAWNKLLPLSGVFTGVIIEQ